MSAGFTGRTLHRLFSLMIMGALSGAATGVASFVFLEALDHATEWRIDNGWVVWLLPLAGVAVGAIYDWFGGRARSGTALAVQEARSYSDGVPARMAPLVFSATVVGHLFGASLGREGAAVQISSSITEAGARRLRVDRDHRAALARAALAGGFGALFGVPIAGVVFALEITRTRPDRWRRHRRSAMDQAPGTVNVGLWASLAAAVPAAFVGDAVVRRLSGHHTANISLDVPFEASTIASLAIGGVLIGLAGRLFAAAVGWCRVASSRLVSRPWLRPALGAAATLALMAMAGRQYLGLSLPLMDQALAGEHIDSWQPALKLVFTAVALGTGFVGGEVTPLFVMGATLGSVLAGPLPIGHAAMASLGMAAMFGAAAQVPVACAVLTAEIFGGSALLPALVVCLCARAVVGRTSIYEHTLDV